jgi:hypothetical protein
MQALEDLHRVDPARRDAVDRDSVRRQLEREGA